MTTTDLIRTNDNPRLTVDPAGDEALTLLRSEMAALSESELSPMNVDISLAVSRALGVLPAVARDRARMGTECPNADLHAIDSLEARALAAAAANVQFEAAVNPPQGLLQLVAEAFDARTVLNNAVALLVSCGILSQEQFAGLKGGHGYRDAADDILLLARVFTSNWDQVNGQVPFNRDHLNRLRGVGERILRLLGEKDLTPVHATDIAKARARAFTLLDRSYDEIRRVLTFVRWTEGDVDLIAPSLRINAGRRDRHRKRVSLEHDSDTGLGPLRVSSVSSTSAILLHFGPYHGAAIPSLFTREARGSHAATGHSFDPAG